MLMMKIGLDIEKIDAEKRYSAAALRQTLDNAFAQMQLCKVAAPEGEIVYRDSGSSCDYARFGKLVNTLKKQPWFMENVSLWRLYDSDDSEDPNDFSEEDLLLHYRAAQRKVS